MTLTRRDFGRNVLAGITAGTLIGAGCDSGSAGAPDAAARSCYDGYFTCQLHLYLLP